MKLKSENFAFDIISCYHAEYLIDKHRRGLLRQPYGRPIGRPLTNEKRLFCRRKPCNLYQEHRLLFSAHVTSISTLYMMKTVFYTLACILNY